MPVLSYSSLFRSFRIPPPKKGFSKRFDALGGSWIFFSSANNLGFVNNFINFLGCFGKLIARAITWPTLHGSQKCFDLLKMVSNRQRQWRPRVFIRICQEFHQTMPPPQLTSLLVLLFSPFSLSSSSMMPSSDKRFHTRRFNAEEVEQLGFGVARPNVST